jgi:hypothetical protein
MLFVWLGGHVVVMKRLNGRDEAHESVRTVDKND